MDKNTIIGFILIAAVLIGYSWWQQPSAEQIAEMKRQDSLALVAKEKAQKEAKALQKAAQLAQKEKEKAALEDTTALFYRGIEEQQGRTHPEHQGWNSREGCHQEFQGPGRT